MFQTAVNQYRQACANVKNAIKGSNYKDSYFRNALGFERSPAAYYRRLKLEKWEPEHLEKLALLLDGKMINVEVEAE